MRIGHGSHPRTPRWVVALLLIGAALALPGARWLGAQEGDRDLKEGQGETRRKSGKPLPPAPGLSPGLLKALAAPPAPEANMAAPTYEGQDLITLDVLILEVPSELIEKLSVLNSEDGSKLTTAFSLTDTVAEDVGSSVDVKNAVHSDLNVAGSLAGASVGASALEVRQTAGYTANAPGRRQVANAPVVLNAQQTQAIEGWLAKGSESKVVRVSSPRVTTISGRKATCTIGQQRPFLSAMDGKQPSIHVVETGMTCEFTPTLGLADEPSVEVLCSLSKTDISEVREIEKTADDGSTVTLQRPTITKQEITFGIDVPTGGTFAAAFGTKPTDAGDSVMLYVVKVDRIVQPKGDDKAILSDEEKAANTPPSSARDASISVAASDKLPSINSTGAVIAVPTIGPKPIAFDFAYPVEQSQEDSGQVFRFFMGLTRDSAEVP